MRLRMIAPKGAEFTAGAGGREEVRERIETEAARFSGLPLKHLRWEDHEVVCDPEMS